MKKKNEKAAHLVEEINKALGDKSKSSEIFYLLKKQGEISTKQKDEIIKFGKDLLENQRILKSYLNKYVEAFSFLKQRGDVSQLQQADLIELEKRVLESHKITKESLVKLVDTAKTLKVVLPKTFDVKVINSDDFPTEFRISNLDEILSPPDEVSIKQPQWLPDFFEDVFKFVTQPLIKTVKKQLQDVNITGPTDPSKAIAVRLSDGKRFYTAILQAISAASSNSQKVEDLLQAIANNTDTLELKADQVNLNTDTLEAKLQTLIDGNLWQRAVIAGTGFVATTNNITVANANETVFMLIKNPSNSGKTARLHRLTIGSDQNQANKMAFYRIYRDPTITNNGTALNINNLKKGAGVSALTAFRMPSVSDNGMLLAVGNAGAVIQGTEQMDLGNLILAGENILITVDATAGGFDFFVTAYWEEV